MQTQSQDPRTIITPDAFSVDRALLGMPLAPPRRRAVALFIDVILVGLITALTSGFWFVLGVVIAAFFFTTARKPGKGDRKSDRLSTVFRLFLGCMGVTALLVTITVFFGLRFLRDRADEGPALAAMVSAMGDSGEINLSGGLEGVLGGLAEGAQILTSESPEEVVRLATRLGRRLEATGTVDDVEDALAELIPHEVGGVDGEDLLERIMANLASSAGGESADPGEPSEPDPDDESAAEIPAAEPAAVEEAADREGERARAEALALASDTIGELQDRLDRAERDLDRTQAELQQAQESRGLFGWFADRVESLGFGLGWWTMYFAVLMPWMKGQTPGKRVLGIRVVRLDGQPVTWWHAFERAGGYAAGFATGTLGFAQIYWDPNRQAIHDKIAGTVVTLDGAPKVPGRWDLGAQDSDGKTTDTPGDA